MAQLVTTAVIRAHDQLTAPLNAMSRNVRRVNAEMRTSGEGVRQSGQRFNRFATGVGLTTLSMTGLIQSARETQDALQGVGYAKLFDAVKDGGGNVDNAMAEIEKATGSVMRLSAELQALPSDLAKANEALAKAGLETKLLDDASRNIQIAKFSDPEANIEQLAAYTAGVLGLAKAYKLLDGASDAEFIKRALGSATAVAGLTPLSTGTFIQAKAGAQGIMSAAGLRLEQQDALLGVLAARNVSADVSSTTLRSNITNVLSPTAQRMKSWSASGLRRADYVDAGAMDITRIIQGLRGQAAGRLSAKELQSLERDIMKASKDGDLLGNEFTAFIQGKLGKMLGLDMSQEMNVDAVSEMWRDVAQSGGVKVDLVKLLRDVQKKNSESPGRGDAILGQIFEQKRRSANLALLSGFGLDEKTGEILYDKLEQASKDGVKNLDKQLELYQVSPMTALRRLEAQWQRLMVGLANGPAVQTFMKTIEGGVGALDKINPELLNFGVRLATIGLVAVPAVAAARALGTVGLAGLAAAAGLGRFVRVPFLMIAAGLRSTAIAVTILGRARVAEAAMGLRLLAGGLGMLAAVAAPVAVIGSLVALSQLDWSKVAAGDGALMLFAEVAKLGDNLDAIVRSFLSMFGIDVKGSILYAGVDGLLGLLGLTLKVINSVIERLASPRQSGEIKNSPRQLKYDSIEQQDAALSRDLAAALPGMMGKRLPPLSLLPLDQRGGSVALSNEDSLAAKLASAVVAGMKGVTLSVTAPSTMPKASATNVETQNGGSYRGR